MDNFTYSTAKVFCKPYNESGDCPYVMIGEITLETSGWNDGKLRAFFKEHSTFGPLWGKLRGSDTARNSAWLYHVKGEWIVFLQ